MREIKFRGRCEGKWYYGTPIHTHIGTYIVTEENPHVCSVYGYMEIDEFVKIDNETIGQFTGLHDKNGKEIYEGDIVLTKYGRICEIGWFGSECHHGWDLNPIEWKNKVPDQYDLYLSENLEVIGNIHDNPELLKGGEI